MTRHVAPEDLIAYAEDRTSAEAAAGIAATLVACEHCRRRLDDYHATRALWSAGFGPAPRIGAVESESAAAPVPSASLDRAMDAIIRDAALRGAASGADGDPKPPRRFPIPAPLLLIAALVALLYALKVAFGSANEPPRVPSALEGLLVVAEAAETVRGDGERTYHWEFVFGEGGELAIFALVDERVVVAYPDPNPFLGTYGRTAPFGAGERVRIPPAPTFDPVLRSGAAAPTAFAVRFTTRPDAAALAAAASEASGAISRGAEAVRESLAARFGDVVLLKAK